MTSLPVNTVCVIVNVRAAVVLLIVASKSFAENCKKKFVSVEINLDWSIKTCSALTALIAECVYVVLWLLNFSTSTMFNTEFSKVTFSTLSIVSVCKLVHIFDYNLGGLYFKQFIHTCYSKRMYLIHFQGYIICMKTV